MATVSPPPPLSLPLLQPGAPSWELTTAAEALSLTRVGACKPPLLEAEKPLPLPTGRSQLEALDSGRNGFAAPEGGDLQTPNLVSSKVAGALGSVGGRAGGMGEDGVFNPPTLLHPSPPGQLLAACPLSWQPTVTFALEHNFGLEKSKIGSIRFRPGEWEAEPFFGSALPPHVHSYVEIKKRPRKARDPMWETLEDIHQALRTVGVPCRKAGIVEV